MKHWAERFAKLDFPIHDRLHAFAPHVAQDAECPGTEFHPALHPTHDLLLGDLLCYKLTERIVAVKRSVDRVCLAEKCFDRRVAELGAA